MNLTDTQRVLLSGASRRPDLAIEIPATLKGGAAKKVLARLTSEGLVEQRGESLVATPAGLAAIGVATDAENGLVAHAGTPARAATKADKRRAAAGLPLIPDAADLAAERDAGATFRALGDKYQTSVGNIQAKIKKHLAKQAG